MTVRRDVHQMREVEEALRRSEAKYRQIFEKIQDVFFQIDDQGIIVEISPSVERYGYTREELIGSPAVELYEEPKQRITLRQLLEKGEITDSEARLKTRDGRVVDFSVSSHVLWNADGSPAGMEGCLRDITDRKRAEEALRRSERELAIRNKIADIFLTVPDEEMYGEALQVVLEALESRYGVFGYIDEDGALVCASLTRDVWEQCRVPDKRIVFPPEQWGGIWGRALTEKRSLYSNEPGRVPEGHIPILNALAVPIIHRKRVIGLLHVSNKETGYDDNDQRLLETIAGHIAPILRARLQRDRQERRRRLAEEELKRHRDRLEELVDERTAELTQANKQLLREIEERKQAEQALRESEAKLKEAQALGRIGSWEFDVGSEEITWSDQTYQLYDRDPALGPPTSEEEATYYSQEQALKLREYARCAIEEGKDFKHDFGAELPSGRRVFYTATMHPIKDVNGRVVKLFGTVQDITERRQAEAALRESEQRFRQVLDVSSDMIYKLDLQSDTFDYVSPSALEMTGFTPEESIAMGPRGLSRRIHPEDWPDFKRGAEEFVELGSPAGFEYRLQCKDSEYRWLSDNRALVRGEDGRPLALVGTVRDVTERRQAEEQARQLHAEHVRANELGRMVRILEQMAATLGHELRNPLGVIGNSVYFLANQAQIDDPKAQKHVEIIGREVAGARRVIDDILEFAHVPQLLPAAASINAVVDSALARSQIPANIRVVRKLAVDLPPLICDEERLERALIDIITNAVQSMPHGGRLGVKTSQSGDEIKVVVSDSGVGIARENIDKVFDPMFTTKLRGIGLGLTVVRRTVEQHGGEISVRSRLGRGAVFAVALPRDCRPFATKGGRVA